MGRFANFIITGLVLWAMTWLFPSRVQIDGFWKLVIATVLLWIIELIIYLIATAVATVGIFTGGCAVVITSVVVMMFAKVIALSILDSSLDGFTMEGFWIKVLTAFLCSLLCTDSRHY